MDTLKPPSSENVRMPMLQKRMSSMSVAAKEHYEEHAVCARETYYELKGYVKSGGAKCMIKRIFARKYWVWWAGLLLLIICSAVLSVYHDKIVEAVAPFAARIRAKPPATLVPIALLIIVSIPPLFGHELIIIVCGVIYGLWLSFAIACAGTFLGEILTYYMFKYLFRAKAAKIERKSVIYCCLATLMREKGLPMVVLVRFSAVPGHITTAMQSTIGLGVIVFSIACIISLPKQLAICYLGVLFGQSSIPKENPTAIDLEDPTSDHSHGGGKRKLISFAVLLVTTLATIVAFWYIWKSVFYLRPRVRKEFEERARADGREEDIGVTSNTIEICEIGGSSTVRRISFAQQIRGTRRSLHQNRQNPHLFLPLTPEDDAKGDSSSAFYSLTLANQSSQFSRTTHGGQTRLRSGTVLSNASSVGTLPLYSQNPAFAVSGTSTPTDRIEVLDPPDYFALASSEPGAEVGTPAERATRLFATNGGRSRSASNASRRGSF